MMVEFHRQWLDFDRLEREAKDPTTYRELHRRARERDPRGVRPLRREGHVEGARELAAFLTSTAAVVNTPLGEALRGHCARRQAGPR